MEGGRGGERWKGEGGKEGWAVEGKVVEGGW